MYIYNKNRIQVAVEYLKYCRTNTHKSDWPCNRVGVCFRDFELCPIMCLSDTNWSSPSHLNPAHFALHTFLKDSCCLSWANNRKLKCPIRKNAVVRSSFASVESIQVTPTEAEQETAATYRSVAESYASETSVVNESVKPIVAMVGS